MKQHPEWLTMTSEQRAIAVEYEALDQYFKELKKSKRKPKRDRSADLVSMANRLIVLRYQYAGVVPPGDIATAGADGDNIPPPPPPPPPPWW